MLKSSSNSRTCRSASSMRAGAVEAGLSVGDFQIAGDTGGVAAAGLEDGGRHVIHDLERFLNTLGTIAAIAPLLGLLGTVAGIIHAFNAITASGLGDPRTLSGGIGEALITTAAGLTVAIPSLIAYRYLRGKVERLVIRMEKEAMKLVDALDERGGVVNR